jgi:hypothetical protein
MARESKARATKARKAAPQHSVPAAKPAIKLSASAPSRIHQSWQAHQKLTMKDSAAHDWSHTSDLAITSGYEEPVTDKDDNFHKSDLAIATSHAAPAEKKAAKISHVHNVYHTEDVSTVVNLKNKMPEQSMALPAETGSTDWTHQTDLLMTNGHKVVSVAGAPVHDYTHQADEAALHSTKTILAADRAHDFNHQADLSSLASTGVKPLPPGKFIDPDHDYNHVDDEARLEGNFNGAPLPKEGTNAMPKLLPKSDPYHEEDMATEFGTEPKKMMLHDDIGHNWDHSGDIQAVNKGLGGRYEDYA